MLAVSLVVARMVLEQGTTAPVTEQDAILLVQRKNVTLGGCPGDAGPGMDAAVDAGPPPDGPPPDAPTDAPPGCETIEGDAVSMVVRPRFAVAAGGARFALLFVTPNRPLVEQVEDPFATLAALTVPLQETHVVEVPDPALGTQCSLGGGGCGGGYNYNPPPSFDPPVIGDGGLGDGGIVVETVGPYEIVRVRPPDTAALAATLDSLGYLHQQADLDAIAPYLARGYNVVAVRVSIPARSDMGAALAPLQLTWAGSELRLPVSLGTSTSDGLVVYVAADGRYQFPEAAVSYARHTFSSETGFLTRNVLPATAPASPDDDPLALHEAGDPEYQDVVVTEEIRRVPVEDCNVDVQCGLGCGECSAGGGTRTDFGVLALALVFVLRPRRRIVSHRTSKQANADHQSGLTAIVSR